MRAWRAIALPNPSRAFAAFCRNPKSWCSRPRRFHFGGMASNSPRRGLPKTHALWRMHPERWLESLVVGNIAALDGRLRPESVYAQVPAFAAADRAMI